MRNRFIPVFSFNPVGALCDRHFISHAFDPPLWLTKKRPSQGWRLGRFGGSAGRTARRICVLSGATLPPIARPTLSHRYSPECLRFLRSKKHAERPRSHGRRSLQRRG
jgi:hypothetical protein